MYSMSHSTPKPMFFNNFKSNKETYFISSYKILKCQFSFIVWCLWSSGLNTAIQYLKKFFFRYFSIFASSSSLLFWGFHYWHYAWAFKKYLFFEVIGYMNSHRYLLTTISCKWAFTAWTLLIIEAFYRLLNLKMNTFWWKSSHIVHCTPSIPSSSFKQNPITCSVTVF